MEALACNLAPNSEEEARWLVREVSASIRFIARAQRKQSRMGMERSNPEKAAAVLTEMARGRSQLRDPIQVQALRKGHAPACKGSPGASGAHPCVEGRDEFTARGEGIEGL